MILILIMFIASRWKLIKKDKSTTVLTFAILLIIVATLWSNSILPLKLYPVIVNLGMLILFGISLFFPPTIIERIARIKEPNLSELGVKYTRRVTQVWCIFFIFNGSMAFITTCFMNNDIWALYNGFISYILIGLLFGTEYLFRQKFKKMEEERNGK